MNNMLDQEIFDIKEQQCVIENEHCHDWRTDRCIKYIDDCQEHFDRCDNDCHNECGCKDYY